MHFHANYVSTSVFGDGDYYQATFEAEQDTDDPDSPYLLIQRQFEDPDDDLCYVETHDEKYRGHFLLRRVDFTPQKLSIELDRPRDNFVSVTFCDGGHRIRRSITGGKDHQWRDRASLMRVCQMKYRNRGDSTRSCADERASALPEKADYPQRKSLISSVPKADHHHKPIFVCADV